AAIGAAPGPGLRSVWLREETRTVTREAGEDDPSLHAYYIIIRLTYTTFTRHGKQDSTPDGAHRPQQEKSLRTPLRQSRHHSLASRAPTDPRLSDRARRQLRQDQHRCQPESQ